MTLKKKTLKSHARNLRASRTKIRKLKVMKKGGRDVSAGILKKLRKTKAGNVQARQIRKLSK